MRVSALFFSQNWRKFGKKKLQLSILVGQGTKVRKGMRELRSLVSSINYDKKAGTNSNALFVSTLTFSEKLLIF